MATLNPPTKFRLDDPYKDYFVCPAPDSNPLVIDWKGKIGYGDVISVSYTHLTLPTKA